ncbi:hypothetical protein ACH5RR_029966 [Cinchona calisaya]|uniref:Bet v I/Major latex protein domain-containing protein n=1 Tax=Cinchona calisaya TaxID=153742 RepID=A0ABD2YX19_9GENT
MKAPAHYFLEVSGRKKDYLPKICPDKVPSIELLEGNWGDVGSIILVHYSLGGQKLLSWESVEAVDKENQSITYNFFKGDPMKMYKTLKVSFQVSTVDEKNYLKWTYVYEKLNADVPAPDAFKVLAGEIADAIDAHYVELQNKCQGIQA